MVWSSSLRIPWRTSEDCWEGFPDRCYILLFEDLNGMSKVKFLTNRILKTSALSVKSVKTDYSPLRCQGSSSAGSSQESGKVLPVPTSATKHPREFPSRTVIHTTMTEQQNIQADHAMTLHTQCRSMFSQLRETPRSHLGFEPAALRGIQKP